MSSTKAMHDHQLSSMTVGLVLLAASFSWCNGQQSYGVGAMLSAPEFEKIFDDAVTRINADSNSLLKKTKLNGSSYVLNSNPIRSALDVCEQLVANNVISVIVSHPEDKRVPPISVSYACNFYQIPVIGISARESIFSDKVI